ncbi:hypothetical protein Hanom_Chr13g01187441 [Helianthus anomalus]
MPPVGGYIVLLQNHRCRRRRAATNFAVIRGGSPLLSRPRRAMCVRSPVLRPESLLRVSSPSLPLSLYHIYVQWVLNNEGRCGFGCVSNTFDKGHTRGLIKLGPIEWWHHLPPLFIPFAYYQI